MLNIENNMLSLTACLILSTLNPTVQAETEDSDSSYCQYPNQLIHEIDRLHNEHIASGLRPPILRLRHMPSTEALLNTEEPRDYDAFDEMFVSLDNLQLKDGWSLTNFQYMQFRDKHTAWIVDENEIPRLQLYESTSHWTVSASCLSEQQGKEEKALKILYDTMQTTEVKKSYSKLRHFLNFNCYKEQSPDFKQHIPIVRKWYSSLVTAQKLLADFPENALQPFVSVENQPVYEVLPAVFEQLPSLGTELSSPHATHNPAVTEDQLLPKGLIELRDTQTVQDLIKFIETFILPSDFHPVVELCQSMKTTVQAILDRKSETHHCYHAYGPTLPNLHEALKDSITFNTLEGDEDSILILPAGKKIKVLHCPPKYFEEAELKGWWWNWW